jgi:hypothetical protein
LLEEDFAVRNVRVHPAGVQLRCPAKNAGGVGQPALLLQDKPEVDEIHRLARPGGYGTLHELSRELQLPGLCGQEPEKVQGNVMVGVDRECRLIVALGLVEPPRAVVLEATLDELVDSRRPRLSHAPQHTIQKASVRRGKS